MVTSPKTGQELEPERGGNAPEWLRTLLGMDADSTENEGSSDQ